MKKLLNKTVFITGGLSGIGRACAIAAANEGANIVITDLPSDKTSKEMEEILHINAKAIFVGCDVSKYKEVENAVALTVKTFGSLDIALNNAGIGGESGKVSELSEQAWLKVIAVNLNGVFNCMKHQLIQMTKQGEGVIVNMSSILGKVGFTTSSHYVAAKHGVIGLTQTAALEYASAGIRINAICPGFVATPLLDHAGISEGSQIKKQIIGLHPMQRLGASTEIADGFIFLASNQSSFITGTSLDIDGGYLAQ